MNIAKFITTVLFTVIYVSCMWLIILNKFDITLIKYPTMLIPDILFMVGTLGIIIVGGMWLEDHWNE